MMQITQLTPGFITAVGTIIGILVAVQTISAAVVKLFVSREIQSSRTKDLEHFNAAMASVKSEITSAMQLRDERAERRTETVVSKLDQQTAEFNARFLDLGKEFIRRETADQQIDELRRRVSVLEDLLRRARK